MGPSKAKSAKATKAGATKAKAAKDGAPKAGTKLALLTEMVSGKGATTAELCRALGWQPHTLRAAICRLPIKPKHTASMAAPATGSEPEPDAVSDVHRQR